MRRCAVTMFCWLMTICGPTFAEDVPVPSARVAVIDEVDVPARRAGSLRVLSVREGSRVAEGAEIGRVDDAAAALAVAKAKLLVDVARKQAAADAAVELAKKMYSEARAAVKGAELQLSVAERTAANELPIRAAESALAKARADVTKWGVEVEIAGRQAISEVEQAIAAKTRDAAQNELDRAVATRRRVGDAVSQSEIDTLQLVRDKSKLEVDRAAEDREIVGMTKDLKSAEQEASRADVTSASVGVQQATFEHEMSRLAVDLEEIGVIAAKLAVETAGAKVDKAVQDADLVKLQAEVAEADHAIANEELARHAVVSPVGGVVVERYRNRGEWVQPGENVVRILRLDRLRAEAFVDASLVDAGTVGSAVEVTVTTRRGTRRLPGEVVYVSPEVDTLKGQVLVWAEFDNPDFAVLPGGKCSMVIREGVPATRGGLER